MPPLSETASCQLDGLPGEEYICFVPSDPRFSKFLFVKKILEYSASQVAAPRQTHSVPVKFTKEPSNNAQLQTAKQRLGLSRQQGPAAPRSTFTPWDLSLALHYSALEMARSIWKF